MNEISAIAGIDCFFGTTTVLVDFLLDRRFDSVVGTTLIQLTLKRAIPTEIVEYCFSRDDSYLPVLVRSFIKESGTRGDSRGMLVALLRNLEEKFDKRCDWLLSAELGEKWMSTPLSPDCLKDGKCCLGGVEWIETECLLLTWPGRCDRRLGGGAGLEGRASSISPCVLMKFSVDRLAKAFKIEEGVADGGRTGVFGWARVWASSFVGCCRSELIDVSRIDGKCLSWTESLDCWTRLFGNRFDRRTFGPAVVPDAKRLADEE